MSSLELKVPPPLIGLTVAAAMWLLAGALPDWGWDYPWRVELALLVALVGVGFDLAGLIAFRVARTTINPLKPGNSSALVVSGVYRLTRNPMYVGMLFLLFGWAAWLGHALAVLLIPVFVVYISRFQIAPEERILRSKFGEPFDAYTRRVRRWL